MAKSNPQWKGFEKTPKHHKNKRVQEPKMLAVFSGANHYITPAWYEEAFAVPTWNYVSVHVSGSCEVVQDQKVVIEKLNHMVQFYEQGRKPEWKPDFNSAFMDNMLEGLVVIKMKIDRIEGKEKLSAKPLYRTAKNSN